MTLSEFMAQIAADTYPEPRTSGHDSITARFAPDVAELLEPGAMVRDVGCGQGPALEWFSAAGFHPHGIALNEEDVDACKALGFEARIADQNAIPYPEGFFGAVWARHVLEHSIAPYWTLHEFARVLEPSGILYVEVPSPGTSCAHETNQNHYSVMGLQMWINLIERAGFSLIHAYTINLQTGAGPDAYFSITCRKN